MLLYLFIYFLDLGTQTRDWTQAPVVEANHWCPREVLIFFRTWWFPCKFLLIFNKPAHKFPDEVKGQLWRPGVCSHSTLAPTTAKPLTVTNHSPFPGWRGTGVKTEPRWRGTGVKTEPSGSQPGCYPSPTPRRCGGHWGTLWFSESRRRGQYCGDIVGESSKVGTYSSRHKTGCHNKRSRASPRWGNPGSSIRQQSSASNTHSQFRVDGREEARSHRILWMNKVSRASPPSTYYCSERRWYIIGVKWQFPTNYQA